MTLRICILFLFTLLPLQAQTPLPDATQKKIDVLQQQAAEAFQRRDFSGAESKLDDADKLSPNNAALLNLRGCIDIEQRDFAKAGEYLQKAVQADPKFFFARFNQGESLFLQKKYDDAQTQFSAMVKDADKQTFQYDLVQYKIFLCLLLTGKTADAQKMFGTFDFAGDTPLYYFAKASLSFNQSKKEEAYIPLAYAQQSYPSSLVKLFAESLIDLGWVDRPPPAPASVSPP